MQRRAYRPVYEASASFTVRVANPLYASVSSYNEKTAQVMADTFPSILTSGLLQRRVMDELGIEADKVNAKQHWIAQCASRANEDSS